MAENLWLFYGTALVVGLLVGSFLNVVILRLPPTLEFQWKKDYAEFTEQPFDLPEPPGLAMSRSHCPQCKKQLSAWHNIPLISYLALMGKCHFCRHKISMRYPTVEALTGLLTLLAAVIYGFGWEFLFACVLIWLLVVITFIDLDTFLIPDQLSLSLMWVGLLASLFNLTVSPEQAITGALIGYLSLWLVYKAFKLLTGKEGMGYGDFKLLAAGGAWLGPEMLIAVLFIASISGLAYALIQMLLKNKQSKIPFGPYLSVGILVSYLYQQQIADLLFPGL